MKITVVCDVLGKENNGTTIAGMNLIRSLKSKYHEVRVICPDEDKKGQPGYYVVDMLNLGHLNGYVRKNDVVLAKPDKEMIKELVITSDLVHIMMPFSLSHAAAKLANENHIPLTGGFHAQAENITSHIFMKNLPFANHIAYRVMYQYVYKYCDAIHYPTEFIRDLFEQEIKKKTNSYVISNGVGDRFKNNGAQKPDELRNKFVILFTGRYSKEKAHRVLIDAVSQSKHEKDIQLIFAGDGPLKDKLKKQARKLTNFPIFKFFPHNQMLNVLSFSDLYVHPADIEIEAIACLEAISCSLVPVISDSKRSATKKFALDERNLFKSNDPKDLAEKIDFFIENPDILADYKERYKGIADAYSQRACMDKMEEMMIKTSQKV